MRTCCNLQSTEGELGQDLVLLQLVHHLIDWTSTCISKAHKHSSWSALCCMEQMQPGENPGGPGCWGRKAFWGLFSLKSQNSQALLMNGCLCYSKTPRVKQWIYTSAGALPAVAAPAGTGQVAPPQFLTPLRAAAANECIWSRPISYASCTSCNPSSTHLAHLLQVWGSYQRASQDCNVFTNSKCCESTFQPGTISTKLMVQHAGPLQQHPTTTDFDPPVASCMCCASPQGALVTSQSCNKHARG